MSKSAPDTVSRNDQYRQMIEMDRAGKQDVDLGLMFSPRRTVGR
jgi:hypothetical protein